MVTYAHKTIVSTIQAIDTPPDDADSFRAWIRAGAHLSFLDINANSDELVVFASGPYTYICSIAVPLKTLASGNSDELLDWNVGPASSIASYVSGGGRSSMWIERGSDTRGAPALNKGIDLVFSRTFEGWTGLGRNYFEINQEYTHLSNIHWRQERNAYCNFDRNGDLSDIVSTTTSSKDQNVNLVTFTWHELEEYLAIAGFALVRMFDFTLFRHGQFGGWDSSTDQVIRLSADFLYRQKIIINAAYTRGVQIIRPRDVQTVSNEISNRWKGQPKDHEHISFIAQDWRHGNKVVEMSTMEGATTNYFQAKNNDLPYELSPAYFRPEVLSKYKTDREKYTVTTREITCRTAWTLRGYDVNDAGQVFAYICYLRSLPYAELLHWKSYNEPPKAGISERAFINDFEGEFVTFQHPREETLSILRNWQTRNVSWWTLRDEDLFDRANPPISSSKDEWADAIMDLSKLVVEGLETKPIRTRLDEKSLNYAQSDKTISLLEKLLTANDSNSDPVRLEGLRAVQSVRSKIKGHSGSTEGREIAQMALEKHGTYAEHFKAVCAMVVNDLKKIENAFQISPTPSRNTASSSARRPPSPRSPL